MDLLYFVHVNYNYPYEGGEMLENHFLLSQLSRVPRTPCPNFAILGLRTLYDAHGARY